ncbi:MAG TPA: hypothetical protein V6C52_14265 [Coleofasciculaceae cyanobacterium]
MLSALAKGVLLPAAAAAAEMPPEHHHHSSMEQPAPANKDEKLKDSKPQEHQHHHEDPSEPEPQEHQHHHEDPSESEPQEHHHHHDPSDSEPQTPAEKMMGQIMQRSASPLSWQPDNNPMLMNMKKFGKCQWMSMWNAKLGANYQGGKKEQSGGMGVDTQNWVMGSGVCPLGDDTLVQLDAGLSAEPLTIGSKGTPLLYQNDEGVKGQHAHKGIMVAGAQLYRHWGKDIWSRFSFHPVGEVAFGPPPAPHRLSALLNSEAPDGHHTAQDSSHITEGCPTTVAVMKDRFMLEGSAFNNGEPRNNYSIPGCKSPDSWSTRASYAGENWGGQVSYKNAKDHHGSGKRVNEYSASVLYNETKDPEHWVAATGSVGYLDQPGGNGMTMMLEGTKRDDKNFWFGRVQGTKKQGLVPENIQGYQEAIASAVHAAEHDEHEPGESSLPAYQESIVSAEHNHAPGKAHWVVSGDVGYGRHIAKTPVGDLVGSVMGGVTCGPGPNGEELSRCGPSVHANVTLFPEGMK